MNPLDDLYTRLTLPAQDKLVLLVLDGLGDIATARHGYMTPLEAASTPHLDGLVQDSVQGRMHPVAPGITPGSGPGHLGLFGYDPLEHQVGRGVIEALGLGLELKEGDVAARANFCTLDPVGVVTDRRAGRIGTGECERLCGLLASRLPSIEDAEILIRPGRGHRFVVVLRGEGMEGPLSDADPHREGRPVPPPGQEGSGSEKTRKTARILTRLQEEARSLLRDEGPANGILLRGIAHKPLIPSFQERYSLRPACLAVYPMYKGLAQLVGMDKIECGQTIEEQFRRYLEIRDDYDFFFIHYKHTDMHGEDGDFQAKTEAIEALDQALPILLERRPGVLAVTGDHSTPCDLEGHSWHPQPVLLHSPWSGSDKLDHFTETSANLGSLGCFEAKYLMRLMQANARMFDKYGA